MAISEVRTQIYLSKQMAVELKKRARARKISLAQLVRAAIGKYFDEDQMRDIESGNDSFSHSLGSIVADADLAQNHDRYIYGWDKQNKQPMNKKSINYVVILERETSGGYSTYVPSLPGCASQGETRREALKNIREAISLYLWSLEQDKLPIPKRDLEFETIHLAA